MRSAATDQFARISKANFFAVYPRAHTFCPAPKHIPFWRYNFIIIIAIINNHYFWSKSCRRIDSPRIFLAISSVDSIMRHLMAQCFLPLSSQICLYLYFVLFFRLVCWSLFCRRCRALHTTVDRKPANLSNCDNQRKTTVEKN